MDTSKVDTTAQTAVEGGDAKKKVGGEHADSIHGIRAVYS